MGEEVPLCGRGTLVRSLPQRHLRSSTSEDVAIVTGVTLSRTYIAHATVSVLVVVPMDEVAGPAPRILEIDEAATRELRPTLRRAEQSFDKRVVIAHGADASTRA
jgi:hypothetical protein